jgi:hypothetical protein
MRRPAQSRRPGRRRLTTRECAAYRYTSIVGNAGSICSLSCPETGSKASVGAPWPAAACMTESPVPAARLPSFGAMHVQHATGAVRGRGPPTSWSNASGLTWRHYAIVQVGCGRSVPKQRDDVQTHGSRSPATTGALVIAHRRSRCPHVPRWRRRQWRSQNRPTCPSRSWSTRAAPRSRLAK